MKGTQSFFKIKLFNIKKIQNKVACINEIVDKKSLTKLHIRYKLFLVACKKTVGGLYEKDVVDCICNHTLIYSLC